MNSVFINPNEEENKDSLYLRRGRTNRRRKKDKNGAGIYNNNRKFGNKEEGEE